MRQMIPKHLINKKNNPVSSFKGLTKVESKFALFRACSNGLNAWTKFEKQTIAQTD